VALLEIERRCREVEERAAATAARTLDVAMGARFRALAQRCGEVAAAAAVAQRWR
jgi:hypothetical protein